MQVNNKLRPSYMACEQELEEAQRKLERGAVMGLESGGGRKGFFWRVGDGEWLQKGSDDQWHLVPAIPINSAQG